MSAEASEGQENTGIDAANIEYSAERTRSRDPIQGPARNDSIGSLLTPKTRLVHRPGNSLATSGEYHTPGHAPKSLGTSHRGSMADRAETHVRTLDPGRRVNSPTTRLTDQMSSTAERLRRLIDSESAAHPTHSPYDSSGAGPSAVGSPSPGTSGHSSQDWQRPQRSHSSTTRSASTVSKIDETMPNEFHRTDGIKTDEPGLNEADGVHPLRIGHAAVMPSSHASISRTPSCSSRRSRHREHLLTHQSPAERQLMAVMTAAKKEQDSDMLLVLLERVVASALALDGNGDHGPHSQPVDSLYIALSDYIRQYTEQHRRPAYHARQEQGRDYQDGFERVHPRSQDLQDVVTRLREQAFTPSRSK